MTLNKIQAKVVVALVNNNLNGMLAAQELHYHHNNIYYHMRKIHKNTGLDPRNINDLAKLYTIAKGVLSCTTHKQ